MEEQEKWFTDQERRYLWGELEHYLEDEEWSQTLEEDQGLVFDAAVVKSTWVKLDRFDQQGPVGLQFTDREQALLWALMFYLVGDQDCSQDGDHECTEDCPDFGDLVDAIIRKLPAPALQHNRVVELERLIDLYKRMVFINPGESTEEYNARRQALTAQHLREQADELATLENMLKRTDEQDGRS